MRWLVFVFAMGLSISLIRQLPWPGWAQVATALAVNLIVGAAIWSGRDQGEPTAPDQRQ